MHPLDSPVWGSLTTSHVHLAARLGDAVALPRAIGIFAAYEPGGDGSGLAELLGGHVGLLIGQEPPDDVRVLGGGPGHQMVLDTRPRAAPPEGLVELGPDDHDDMHALVAATEPGPWAPETPRLGTYLGVRAGGRLVAMAGERMHPPGHTEISAVCTHPDARRAGLASALVAELARRIFDRGEVPFLHVAVTNEAARPVYEKLGFRERRMIDFTAIAPLDGNGDADQ